MACRSPTMGEYDRTRCMFQRLKACHELYQMICMKTLCLGASVPTMQMAPYMENPSFVIQYELKVGDTFLSHSSSYGRVLMNSTKQMKISMSNSAFVCTSAFTKLWMRPTVYKHTWVHGILSKLESIRDVRIPRTSYQAGAQNLRMQPR